MDAVRKADGDNGASGTGLVPAATEADGALPFEARAAVLASLADTQPIPVVTDMEPHAVPGITPPDTGPGVNEAGTRAGAEAGEGPPRAADAGPADRGKVDAGPADAGPADAGTAGAGLAGAGTADGGTADGGTAPPGGQDADGAPPASRECATGQG